jgi:hypothetical protein
MRLAVADILVKSMKSLGLNYPQVDDEARRELEGMREVLEAE